ncbi:hypothetical protein Vadar_029827 [Vaccinium darrowii]|uniref:Uncharacterized protein n=1 Tax=Vaccinium darrowii TaxID=229202 RepID=A0ACB7YGY6_9ERIC|nr:hypothetical protein Vadar_029827 [Vaccinium darrowii]
MDRMCFMRLCNLVQTIGGLSHSRSVCLEEKVAMFLRTIGHYHKNRVVKHEFYRSGQTVSRHFNDVLHAILRLQGQLLVNPEPITQACTDERWRVFQMKSGYLNKLEGMLLAALPGTDIRANPHIASKIKVWKKNYYSVKDMRNTSGFGWNDSTKMVEVESDTVWEDYCKRDTNAKVLRFKSFPYYDDWSLIFGNDRATGDMAESAADVVETLGVDGNEVLEGSTTVNKNDKSPAEPKKKKAKVSETLMTGLSDLKMNSPYHLENKL